MPDAPAPRAAHAKLEQFETFFAYRLAVAAERFSQNLTEVYAGDYGLTREEWRLLYLLSEVDEINSLDLARRTTLDKVQVTRGSQRLEQKGLITRNVSPNDRRLRLYRATKAGRALFSEVSPQVEARALGVLDVLSPEDRAALNQGIDALIAALETDAHRGE